MEKAGRIRDYKQKWIRISLYILGLFILALGLTINTKCGLGTSPIISVAYTIHRVTSYDLGNVIFVQYTVFVLLQLWLKKDWRNIKVWLQLPLSLVFTRVMNGISALITVGTDSLNTKITLLTIAIICTGIGAALSVNMRMVANPGDGIVSVIADVSGKKMGTVKNIVDIACVLCSIMIAIIFHCNEGGVGIGTFCAMIGVGRVIAVFNRICGKQLECIIA